MMVYNPYETRNPPDPEVVFETLDDEACRDIVSALEDPMTVGQISEAADVPLSTAYKKVDQLREASLLVEQTELRPGGHHRSQYVVGFDRLIVDLDHERQFDVDIKPPASDPERQLVGIWQEIRREA